MKIFLTGGSGFIGGVTGRLLAEQGHEVLGLARSEAAAAKIRAWGGRIVEGDITGDGPWQEVPAECEAVIHAAAAVGDLKRRVDYERINVEGTRRVAESALRAGRDGAVRLRRFVHVSSVAAHSGAGDYDESAPPRLARHAYPGTKAEAELVIDEAVARGLPAVHARISAVYGPGDPHIVTRLLDQARRGRIVVIGDGRQPSNLIHVDDAARALVAMLEAPVEPGERFLVTDPGAPTILEAVRIGFEALGREPRIMHLPLPVALISVYLVQGIARLFGRKPYLTVYAVLGIGLVRRYRNERTRQRLGWEPRVPFREGIAEVIGSLRDATRSEPPGP